jgi:hypothetical protein
LMLHLMSTLVSLAATAQLGGGGCQPPYTACTIYAYDGNPAEEYSGQIVCILSSTAECSAHIPLSVSL